MGKNFFRIGRSCGSLTSLFHGRTRPWARYSSFMNSALSGVREAMLQICLRLASERGLEPDGTART